jgi:general transcription factor 3C polypeptide 1
MDSITSSALEEICFHGKTGLSLASLWSQLNPCLSSSSLDLSLGVKKAVWAALLRVPSLRFWAGNVSYTASDPLIQSLEDAEKLELKIAAEDCLRDNFLGLYNVHAANADIPLNQRRALERIAISRFLFESLCLIE